MGRRTLVSVNVSDVEKRRVPSKHYVYVINVTWSDSSIQTVYRRYSRFFDFQNELLDKFPEEGGKDDPNKRIIPFLPGKKFFGRSHIREVAEKRLKPIDEYCQTLVKLPDTISSSEEVLEFFETDPEDIEPLKERYVSKKAVGKKITGPKLLEQYVAIADYDGQGKGEITLHQGMSIEVAEKTETGWWFVTADDEQGWVPSTYLERRDGGEDLGFQLAEPGEEEEYVVTTAFNPDGPDEIPVEIGDIVLVLEKNLQGWWKVRLNNKEGYVPAAYLSKANPERLTPAQRDNNRLSQGVQVVSSLSEISEYFKSSASSTSPKKKPFVKQPPPRTNSLPRGSESVPVSEPQKRVKGYVTIESFHDTMGDGISFTAGQTVQVLEKNSSGWWFVEIGSNEGWAPAAYIQQVQDTSAETEVTGPSPDPVVSHTRQSNVIESTSQVSDDDEYDDEWEDEDPDDRPQALSIAALAGALKDKLGEGRLSVSKTDTGPPPPPPNKPSGLKVQPVPPAKPPNPPAKPKVTGKPSALPGKLPNLRPISQNQSTLVKPPKTPTKPPAKPSKPSIPPTKPVAPNNNNSTGTSTSNNNSTTGRSNDLASVLQSRFQNLDNAPKSGLKNSAPATPPKSEKPMLKQRRSTFRASATFKAENSGEITLEKGDNVSVIQADDSGWWLVKNRGIEGWAPASYIQEIQVGDAEAGHKFDNEPEQSNNASDGINNKFGARLRTVKIPTKEPVHKGQLPTSALLPPGNKPKSGPGMKGRLPQIPQN